MSNRARKARGLQKPAEIPLDKDRALSRFIRMRGRAVEVITVPSGIVVKAETPAELERETNREIVRRAGETKN